MVADQAVMQSAEVQAVVRHLTDTAAGVALQGYLKASQLRQQWTLLSALTS